MRGYRSERQKPNGKWVTGYIDAQTDESYRIKLRHAPPGQDYFMISKSSVKDVFYPGDSVKVRMDNGIITLVERI